MCEMIKTFLSSSETYVGVWPDWIFVWGMCERISPDPVNEWFVQYSEVLQKLEKQIFEFVKFFKISFVRQNNLFNFAGEHLSFLTNLALTFKLTIVGR